MIHYRYFYPRSPCGERLLCLDSADISLVISIHALLAESDTRSGRARSRWWYFYPRSPCGERQNGAPPAQAFSGISIHALLAESDGASRASSQSRRHFYPRSPCGERRQQLKVVLALQIFLSTLSLRRATHWQTGQSRTRQFLSTLSLRRATNRINDGFKAE